jgi:hypothetical protein
VGLGLNDHQEELRTAGLLSNRLLDAVTSGPRVITDDVAGLGIMFGVHAEQPFAVRAQSLLDAALEIRADLMANGDWRRAVHAARGAG